MANADVNHGFKVGDVVVCVDSGPWLVDGNLYVISHDTGKGDEPGYVRIEGQKRGFFPDRFKLHERKADMKKEAVAVAKAGDVVIPRKFDAHVKVEGLANPGWVNEMEKFVGVAVLARDVGIAFDLFVPMLYVGDYFWPVSHLDVVKDGKVLKAAKRKMPKPKKIRKVALRTKLNAEARVMTCSYGHEYKNGAYNMQSADACHARLKAGTKDNPLVALALHFAKYMEKRTAEDKKTFNKYFNYLANRSPGANAFKTKKASEALSRGILMNVQESAAKIGWACVALRQATEFNGTLPAFEWALKQKGISEHAAFLFANTHRRAADSWSVAMSGSHQCLHGELDFYKMIEAFKHGFYDKGEGPMATGGYYCVSPNWYKGATSGYGERDRVKLEDKLLNVFNKVAPAIEKGVGWQKDVVVSDEVALKRLKFINDSINAVK